MIRIKNVTIFAIIASLAMSINVFWAPVGFFVPQVSAGLQSLMMPSLVYFGVLWVILLALELKVIKVSFTEAADTNKFNFIWLLDVFAFGLVNLAGSGVAATAGNPLIAGLAAAGTIFTLIIGLFILVAKIVYLQEQVICG